MQLFDRVFCDSCNAYLGQLVGGRLSFDDLPHLPTCLCPDCVGDQKDVTPDQSLIEYKAANYD